MLSKEAPDMFGSFLTFTNMMVSFGGGCGGFISDGFGIAGFL
jgi:hypothetical protein